MKILTLCLALFCFVASGAEKAFPSVPKKLLQASHKIAAYNNKTGTTGHGAAVSVDLSEFGLKGSRYILTAAHCISDNGKIRDEISIDYKDKGETKWTGVKVIAMDEDFDIAILTTDVDMPVLVTFCSDIDIGDALITIGSPQATALTANFGFLSDKGSLAEQKHAGWYQGSMAITHGNSGGPVFDPNNETLVGIITAIIGDPGNQAPNIALFVGYEEIQKFLKKNTEKINKFKRKS